MSSAAVATQAALSARRYIARGWAPVPIPFKSKAPIIDGWEKLRLTSEHLPRWFRGRCNLGVLLGEPSGWLVDVDLDHNLAVELADQFLPVTGAEFGRAGKLRSHRLFVVSEPTITYKRPIGKREAAAAGVKPGMIVELRSTGAQTVFPPSTHPEDEVIEWSAEGEPAIVRPDELRAAIDALAGEVRKRLVLPAEQRTPPSIPPRITFGGRTYTSVDSAGAIERGRRYLQSMGPAIAHQSGDDHTFKAALMLVKGLRLSVEQARPLLLAWNATCRPPWTEQRIERNLQRAARAPLPDGYLTDRNCPAWDGKVRKQKAGTR